MNQFLYLNDRVIIDASETDCSLESDKNHLIKFLSQNTIYGDIVQWLDESNIKARWDFQVIKISKTKSVGESFTSSVLFLIFENPADMLLFKLTWDGR